VLKSVNADFRIDILFTIAVHKNIYTMIHANRLYELATKKPTTKPTISMAEIEAACIEMAKLGELYCYIDSPIADKDIERLENKGFEVEILDKATYRIIWSKLTNL
jgi:hypothetical protein